MNGVPDRRDATSTCPTCQVALDPLPTSRTACPACGESIDVRLGPDGLSYLVPDADVPVLDQAWPDSQRTHGVRGIALRLGDEASRAGTGFGGWRLMVVVLVVSLTAGAMVPVGMAILAGVPLTGRATVASVRPSATRGSPAGEAVPTDMPTPSGPTPAATPAPSGPTPTAALVPPLDLRQPLIIGREPGPDASGVAGGSSIEIRFSEPVVGVSDTTVRLRNLKGRWLVRARVRYDATSHTAILTPVLAMYPGTEYRVVISPGITDRSGDPLAPARWSFRTASR